MRIGRVLPPASAPLKVSDLWNGIVGMLAGEASVRRLETELKDHFGARDVLLVSSGKAALVLVLRALKELSGREEVVVPAYTCYSVPAAVLTAGLRIRLCDVDPHTLDFDHSALREAISANTLCVITTNLLGRPCAVERAGQACRRHGTYLIEDAAQAMGAVRDGKYVGTYGDAGIFSFGRGKTITCGQGGAILVQSKEISAVLRRLAGELPPSGYCRQLVSWMLVVAMSALVHPALYWLPAGVPFLGLGETVYPSRIPMRRLSPVQAGLLRTWRLRLENATAARQENARWYRARFASLCLAEGDGAAIRFPLLASQRPGRDVALHASRQRGLGISTMYPATTNEIPEIKHLFDAKTSFPGAKLFAERHLTLPTHPLMTEVDRERVADLCGILTST